MKRIWVFILVVLLAVGATCGIIFGVQSCKKKDDDSKIVKDGFWAVQYFENEQRQDESAVVKIYAFGNGLSKITYQIDTDEEVELTTATGDAEDHTAYKSDYKDMDYIDTGVTLISMSDLDEGDHIIKWFVYKGLDKQQLGGSTIFTIVGD